MSELDEQYYHLPGTVVHLAGGGVFHNWPVVCWSRFSFEPKCMCGYMGLSIYVASSYVASMCIYKLKKIIALPRLA